MQHEHGEQWELIDSNARNVFTSCTPSMSTCITGINHYRQINRMTDKSNSTAACSACSDNEDWDHVVSREKSKDSREEWAK